MGGEKKGGSALNKKIGTVRRQNRTEQRNGGGQVEVQRLASAVLQGGGGQMSTIVKMGGSKWRGVSDCVLSSQVTKREGKGKVAFEESQANS